jgi:hypothetical protein
LLVRLPNRLVTFNISGRSVWEHNSDLVLSGVGCKSCLLWSVVLIAGKTRAVVKSRERLTSHPVHIIFRQKDVESHVALIAVTPVFDSLDSSAESFSIRKHFDLGFLR